MLRDRKGRGRLLYHSVSTGGHSVGVSFTRRIAPLEGLATTGCPAEYWGHGGEGPQSSVSL